MSGGGITLPHDTDGLVAGSLFSGVGGLDLGLARAGFRVAWHAETDPHASAVLAHRWPGVPNLGDVAALDPPPWPVDVLAGGFPCQDVSTQGHKKGLTGRRTGLFFEFVRVARELRPRWLLLENVPGLLVSNSGRDFGTVVETVAAAGWTDVSWRVVDSLAFGVPQRRRRLFVVASTGSAGRSARALLTGCGSGWNPRVPSDEVGCGGMSDPISARGHALPITCSHGQPGFVGGGTVARPRRYTPVECERLQGFPDGWTEAAGSDSVRWRLVGNAVTVPVAEWVGHGLRAASPPARRVPDPARKRAG